MVARYPRLTMVARLKDRDAGSELFFVRKWPLAVHLGEPTAAGGYARGEGSGAIYGGEELGWGYRQ